MNVEFLTTITFGVYWTSCGDDLLGVSSSSASLYYYNTTSNTIDTLIYYSYNTYLVTLTVGLDGCYLTVNTSSGGINFVSYWNSTSDSFKNLTAMWSPGQVSFLVR